jgi:signal transduction histidine kinase
MKAILQDTILTALIFDPGTGHFQILPHPEGRRIESLFPGKNGTAWIMTSPGFRLEIYDGKTFRPGIDLGVEWKGGVLRALAEVNEHEVWLGGAGGGGVYRNGVFHPFENLAEFAESGAFSLLSDRAGNMLAGGRQGIYRFNGMHWSPLLSAHKVRRLVFSNDGTLWVASSDGIHRFTKGNWINNGEEDGLPSSIGFHIFEDSQRRIWAGTSRGLSLYHPEADTDPPRTSLANASNLTEASSDGNIRILFSGIDKWKQTSSDRLLFSYRVDNAAWTPFAAADSALLKGLGRGQHRMEVRSMDRNGNMEQQPQGFEFSVPTPWDRQRGFLDIVGCSGIAILMLLVLAGAHYVQRGSLLVQLNQARVAAESASRYKSEFLANMSHEIRTPMNAIIGMTQLAMGVHSGDEQQEYLSTVKTSADSLLGLLNDVLDLSKVEAGKLELVNTDFNLEDCAGQVLRTLGFRARQAGLTLSLQVGQDVPPFLLGDDQRLRQVLMNLIGNAIKFTRNGGISVEISVEPDAQDGLCLHFIVIDTVIGIPAAKQERIFAAFEQADQSTTRNHGGTGLGLAISSKLVNLMQGRIWVESPWRNRETGEQISGSAFHFTARFLRGHAPQPVFRRDPSIRTIPHRILLAEDNLIIRWSRFAFLIKKVKRFWLREMEKRRSLCSNRKLSTSS